MTMTHTPTETYSEMLQRFHATWGPDLDEQSPYFRKDLVALIFRFQRDQEAECLSETCQNSGCHLLND